MPSLVRLEAWFDITCSTPLKGDTVKLEHAKENDFLHVSEIEVYVLDPNLDLTGWEHVRHVPADKTWHPAKDRLAGTEEYGTYSDNS